MVDDDVLETMDEYSDEEYSAYLEYKELKEDQFSLSDFHENLLKIGNMPPKLMREVLLSN